MLDLLNRNQRILADSDERSRHPDFLRTHVVIVERFREREKTLGRTVLREGLTRQLQKVADGAAALVGIVSWGACETSIELIGRRVRGHRYASRQDESFVALSGCEAKLHDAALEESERRRCRCTFMRCADDYEATNTLR